MPRRLLALLLVLSSLSVAMGLVDPVDPFVPNHLFVADGGTLIHEFDEQGTAQPDYVTGVNQIEGLSAVHDVAFGPDGALYASDFEQDLVLVFDSVGGSAIATVGAGSLDGPTDLLFGPHGDLFVASAHDHAVVRFDSDGVSAPIIIGGSGLANPRGLAIGPHGHLFVSSFDTDEVLEFDAGGSFLSARSAGSALDGPYGLAFSPRNGLLYVASKNNDQVLAFDSAGNAVAVLTPEGLDAPTSLSFGPDGNLFVASEGTGEVLVMNNTGLVDRIVGDDELASPSGLAFSPFVLDAKLFGRTFPVGASASLVKQPVRLNWAPGSGQASVMLLPPQGSNVDADPLFGEQVMVARGFERGPLNPGPSVRFVGKELDVGGMLDGIGSLSFVANGNAINLTGLKSLTGLFSPKKFDGDMMKIGPLGETNTEIRTTK
jgi:sugar lactone lactonase YvrE